jgi:putative sterol carrier protein
VSHAFLSDDWFEAVRAIRDKYADVAPPFPHKLRINQVITAAPFSDTDLKIHLDTSGGQLVIEQGALEGADCTVTTDYDTARKIFVEQDQAAGMQAFMSGKIKVQGDMSKLMAMNMVVPDETAKKIADEIKAVTA